MFYDVDLLAIRTDNKKTDNLAYQQKSNILESMDMAERALTGNTDTIPLIGGTTSFSLAEEAH